MQYTSLIIMRNFLIATTIWGCTIGLAGAQTVESTAASPPIPIEGVLIDSLGQPLTGLDTVIFSLYQEQAGGVPLWVEIQVVQADEAGRFMALLGANTALPVDLLSSGDGRWLGIQPEAQPEQPRVRFHGVPYALNAADGELQGTIYDATGAVLVGASVVVVDGRGQVYETLTGDEGQYRFNPVARGVQTLTAFAEGFGPVTQTVDLTQAATSRLDVTLGVFFSVEVDVNSSGMGTSARGNLSSRVLTGRDIEALPSNPRMLRQRLAEMAGFVGRPGDANFYIDGFRSRFRFPPKGAIQMIRINANTFDAEFQEPGQQRIEIITRPGSSEFFGQLETDFSDESLNGRDPFTVTKPPQQNRTLTSYLSGPLIPNRWGFLVYGGQWQQDENASVHATTLDPATFEPRPVATTVPTPLRINSFAAQLDQLAGANNTLSLGYDWTKSTTRNLGLESGFDLPERSYDRTSTDRAARLSLTSIFDQAVFELRVQLSRIVTTTAAQLSSPAVLVLDAFHGGGNQAALLQRDAVDELEINQALTWGYRTHTFKVGLESTLIWLRNDDRSNFGGVFTFGAGVERDASGDVVLDATGATIALESLERYRRTLQGLPGYGPSQFTINRGNPLIAVRDRRMAWFVQDDWSFWLYPSFPKGVST